MIALHALATALPAARLDGASTRAFLDQAFPSPLVERFGAAIAASRIRTRHIAPPLPLLLDVRDAAGRNLEYLRRATPLAERAIAGALAAAGIEAAAVDALLMVSCTGHALPSLDTHLMNRLPFAPQTRRVPLSGLGCSAGVAAVGIASELLAHSSHRTALICCVELCSLCLQTGAPSPSDVVSSILFADGAAAAVLERRDDTRHPEVLVCRSVLAPDSLAALGMDLTNAGFRLVLDRELPRVVRRGTRGVVDRFLASAGVSLADLRFFAIHPGGPRILDAIGAALALPDRVLQPSWDAWQDVGNVSSATVLFILAQLQRSQPPPDGALGLMLAYGPGLTCELALLRWHGEVAVAAAQVAEPGAGAEHCSPAAPAVETLLEMTHAPR